MAAREIDVAVVGRGPCVTLLLPYPYKFGVLVNLVTDKFDIVPRERVTLEFRAVDDEPTEESAEELFEASARKINSSASLNQPATEHIVGKIMSTGERMSGDTVEEAAGGRRGSAAPLSSPSRGGIGDFACTHQRILPAIQPTMCLRACRRPAATVPTAVGGTGGVLPAAVATSTNALVEQVTALVASLNKPGPTPLSPAGLGHVNLETLRSIPSGITVLEPREGGTCALSNDESTTLVALAKAEHEAGVVAYLTDRLRRLCLPTLGPADPFRLMLINSEALPWLVPPSSPAHGDLRQKPDHFMSWAPFIEFRGNGEATGVLGGYSLQQLGCVAAIFEAKCDRLTESHFGELCGYHTCIQRGSVLGMLFGPTSFQLYKSINTNPVSLLKGDWTTPGSAEAIHSFFLGVDEPPLLLLLRALTRELGVQPIHVGGHCYLGSGASGHVFTVGDPDHPRALKVVLTNDPLNVVREYTQLEMAATRGAPVVRPVRGSLRSDVAVERGVVGCGYMLEAVGQPFVINSSARCTAALESLASIHRLGIIHGDARLPNLLSVGEDKAPAWIDARTFVDCGESVNLLMARDMRTFARSILRLESTAATLPTAVDDTLMHYDAHERGSVVALADAVWGATARRG